MRKPLLYMGKKNLAGPAFSRYAGSRSFIRAAGVATANGAIPYPPILDSAIGWFDDSSLIISGPDVTGWANKGTGGAVYDYIGRTNGTQGPFLSVVNGVNVADLSLLPNTNRKYFTPAVGTLIAQPVTFIVVAKLNAFPGAQATLFDSIAGSPRVVVDAQTGTDTFTFSAGVGSSSGPSTWDLLPHVFVGEADGVNGFFTVTDIVALGPIDVGLNTYTHGTLGANLNLFQTWDGWIGEVAFWNVPLSGADINAVIAYMRTKLGF